MKKALLAALVAAGFTAGNAGAAAIIDFDFSGNKGVKTQLTFSAGGVEVTATGGARKGGSYDESSTLFSPFPKIGQYSHGLGVTSGIFDSHTADNLSSDEYVKFVFGQAVQVLSVTVAYQYQPASMCLPFVGCLWPASGDADASFLVGADPATAWSHVAVAPSHKQAGWYEYTYSLTDLIADEVFRFGARQGQTDDSFKILGMQVSLATPQDPPAQVPLPATLALLGVGALALGASRRRQ
ncbi:MAG TPA: PEP-CTERM sorting domain-containing protein, partial [Burkholderiaceae bacterium]|nr:PEP-CTERM sorting domain-containing protein [Burkholderiaceae bacterium]